MGITIFYGSVALMNKVINVPNAFFRTERLKNLAINDLFREFSSMGEFLSLKLGIKEDCLKQKLIYFKKNLSNLYKITQKIKRLVFYSSQEVIVLDNQKTASAIIKGTYVHTTFYPKCNIYHRLFFFMSSDLR